MIIGIPTAKRSNSQQPWVQPVVSAAANEDNPEGVEQRRQKKQPVKAWIHKRLIFTGCASCFNTTLYGGDDQLLPFFSSSPSLLTTTHLPLDLLQLSIPLFDPFGVVFRSHIIRPGFTGGYSCLTLSGSSTYNQLKLPGVEVMILRIFSANMSDSRITYTKRHRVQTILTLIQPPEKQRYVIVHRPSARASVPLRACPFLQGFAATPHTTRICQSPNHRFVFPLLLAAAERPRW